MFKRVETILQCPQNGHRLYYNKSSNCYMTTDGFNYPVKNGIIDFLYDEPGGIKSDRITSSYDELSAKYDSILTSQKFHLKLYNLFFRGFTSDNFAYKVVDYIPDDFQGIIVDAPAGTGIFTVEKFKKLKDSLIIVVDYSYNMLLESQKRHKKHNINNVIYIHGDMKKLPFNKDSIDLLLSMNGFHALTDKDSALDEINRVLKPFSRFSGCFYVHGKRKLTDIIVNLYHKKKGWFASPFYTDNEVREKFTRHFLFKEIKYSKPIIVFDAEKKYG